MIIIYFLGFIAIQTSYTLIFTDHYSPIIGFHNALTRKIERSSKTFWVDFRGAETVESECVATARRDYKFVTPRVCIAPIPRNLNGLGSVIHINPFRLKCRFPHGAASGYQEA